MAGWTLMYSGGMLAVAGWNILGAGLLLGPLTILSVTFHAIRKRRFSRPMAAAMALAIVSLMPALWLLGLFTITFPYSLATSGPSAIVRLPADNPMRVVWGGDNVKVNRHAMTPDQRWAYDLSIEPGILSKSSRLEDYGCYGKTVVAPVTARVHFAIDGEPDQTPRKLGATKNPLGNAVVFALDTGTYLLVAHLKRGSVLVRAGEQVREGQPIGQCGNSGNTTEPHIHIHHQRQDPKDRTLGMSEGLPLYFRDHGGAAMPEGGFQFRGGKVVLTGAEIRHQGR
ncbi:MAG: M23 family metallopeptidase [Acidobacteria bacterium]|nr:M23 family metallopeptidase [Acidobacteriota bacterium]